MRTRERHGFVLPTVLLLAAILSAAVAGAYTYLDSERRTNSNRQAEIEAVTVANAGLQKFLIDFFRDSTAFPAAKRDSMMKRDSLQWTNIQVASDSSVTLVLELDVSDRDSRRRSNGTLIPDTALVKAFLLRRPTSARDSALWLVRSRGIPARRRAAGEMRAERVVSTYAWIAPGNMSVLGGWTSLTGIQRSGSSSTLDGTDECGEAPSGFGAVVPSDIPNAWSNSGNTSRIIGGVDQARTTATLAGTMQIDWALASVGDNPVPDFILTSGSRSLPNNACLRIAADTTYYPTILVQNGAALTYNGRVLYPGPGWQFDYSDLCPGLANSIPRRGLLIVQGDFRTTGSSGGDFAGIVLVGERFVANGNISISGAVISGLRRTIDPGWNFASEVSDLNGTKIYRYNSCRVRAALRQLSGLRPVRNAWSDGVGLN